MAPKAAKANRPALGDKGQRASRGGQNVWVHLVGTDKPLMTALAIGLSLLAMYIGHLNHESDNDNIREFSDWSAKTYNREVAIDADLQLMGINARQRYGDIPIPPNAQRKKKE